MIDKQSTTVGTNNDKPEENKVTNSREEVNSISRNSFAKEPDIIRRAY